MLISFSAIGLQEGWESFQWVSTIPPILMIAAFKIYINRTFLPKFRWYIPNEEELRLAKVHSERGDIRGGRLEKRFGHPALHAELFTPMLHAKMMPLLPQVYSGRLGNESLALEDFGQKMEASVLPGGIKIAAVHQVSICNYGIDEPCTEFGCRMSSSTTLRFTDVTVASWIGIKDQWRRP